jgi:hypothetical protein
MGTMWFDASMDSAEADLRACLGSVDDMLAKAKDLTVEYDARIRNQTSKSDDVPNLKHAISFAEVHDLDLLCKEALDRYVPIYPSLARFSQDWYVHGLEATDGPEELRDELSRKANLLRHAVHLVEQPHASKGSHPNPQKPKPDGRWPTLVGHVKFVPRWLGTIADLGGGIAIIALVAHWLVGLF